MEQIGVAAVVEGLSTFMSDMGKVDSAIQSLIPTSNLLGGAFDFLGGIVSNFVEGAARVLEYTLGGLIKDAIEAVISAIKDLIGEIITAGSEFQTLSIRLNGLNLPANANEIKDWTAAMNTAKAATKEQLDWIQQLATATPFDTTDIATTYALARSYGNTDEQARRLTKDITDFAAGMGLSGDAIVNTVQNLGQMDQRGKITMIAIRNLTRSAYLPLDDVLGRIAVKLKTTIPELTAEISKPGAGIPAELFIEAFQEMVEQEPRFMGAAGRLGRAFEPAINNVKDLFRNILGLNVVTPILDVLGEHVASVVDEFVSFTQSGDMIKTDKWEALSAAAKIAGQNISQLVGEIIEIFIPGTANLADGLIGALRGFNNWITTNKSKILAGLQQIRDFIFGTQTKKGAIQKFFDWLGSPAVKGVVDKVVKLLKTVWDALFGVSGGSPAGGGRGTNATPGILQNIYNIALALGPVIQPLLGLFEAIGKIIAVAFGGTQTQTFSDWVNQTLIPAIENLTTWFDNNRNSIAQVMQLWLQGALILFALSAAVSIVAAIVTEFVSVIIGWLAEGNKWLIILQAIALIAAVVAAVMSGVSIAVLLVIAAIIALSVAIYNNWDAITAWTSATAAQIGVWVGNTLAALGGWYATTTSQIWAWVGSTLAAFGSWYASTVAQIWNWVANTVTAFSSWVSQTIAKIAQWVSQTIAAISKWATQIYNTVAQGIASMDWFKLGQSIIKGIIAGFTSMSLPALQAPSISATGSASVGYCFTAGTLITMADGTYVAIQDIEVGDYILSWDVKENIPVEAQVEQVYHHPASETPFHMKINELEVTENHPIFINGDWYRAGLVMVGDKMMDEIGQAVRVDSVEYVYGDAETYNLHTGHHTHNYFAGGVLVHNKATGTHGIQTVPPGFNADNFLVPMQSGEKFMVIPKGGQMSSTMAQSTVNSSQQIINNFTLAINSSAKTEPLVADFNMMKSMLGV